MRELGYGNIMAVPRLEKIILNGGGAVGKSPLMPSNPDLTAKAVRQHILNGLDAFDAILRADGVR